MSLRANEILTALIHGARKEEPSPEVQLAAIHALFNSLEFVRDNFEREGERNYGSCVIKTVPVQVGAFECLVRVVSLYYEKMSLYMEQALFGVSKIAILSCCLLILFTVDRCGHEASGRTCRFAGG